MMTIEGMRVVEQTSAELVAESLAGQREAFRQIVERHQTLICSLAYCATGNLAQSEDLAQETFVTAWRQLGELREPAKLRSWLCGIARRLIGKELRRQGREPLHAAEPLEAMDQLAASEPLPPDHAIRQEEQAILWRSLQRLPPVYREPLVLFYREHHSVEHVAQALDLTQDAVKQRLSRGRKLLQEEILALVEGTLERTTPGTAFTVGVLAVLPLLATTAKATTAGATVAAGGAMMKATGLGTLGQALKAMLAIAPVASLGGYVGFQMGRDAGRSPGQRESVDRFWRIVVGCLVVFVALPLLLILGLALLQVPLPKEKLFAGLAIWLGTMYVVVPAALIVWAWQRRRAFQQSETVGADLGGTKRRPFLLWVALGVIASGMILIAHLSDTNWKITRLSSAQAQSMMTEHTHVDCFIFQFQNGSRDLWITLRENGHVSKFSAPADDATLALVAQRRIACPTYVQGRDFEILGWPGRFLVFFCLFILTAGIAVLITFPLRKRPDGVLTTNDTLGSTSRVPNQRA